MDNVIHSLEANEQLISALVGLLTLVAAGWGLLQLAVKRSRPDVRQSDTIADQRYPKGRLGVAWTSILDRGLNNRSELEDLVSVRTLNVTLLCIIGYTFIWLLASLVSHDTVVLTIINFVVFIGALIAFSLQSIGKTAVSRWLLLINLAFYWLANLVAMGPMLGLEYFLAGLLVLPLLLFNRHENGQLAIAIVTMVMVLILAIFLQSLVTINVPASETFVTIGYYANAIFLASIFFLALHFYNNSAANSFRELEDQKSKADTLVRSILPDYVAERMAKSESSVADWHREATVLFATVSGFEALYQRVSAVQLVELWSQIFVEFDHLITRFGIDKVNTLGANYVAATGIGQSDEPDHAQLAAAALGMRDVVSKLSDSVSHPFKVRIGISTGHVVSGSIGGARPSFDIWGETVELANSMQSAAVDNSIVVNEAAYWRLRDYFEFAQTTDEEPRYILLRPTRQACAPEKI